VLRMHLHGHTRIPIHIILIVLWVLAYVVRRPHGHCGLHRHLRRGRNTRCLVVKCMRSKLRTWQACGGRPVTLPALGAWTRALVVKKKVIEEFHSIHRADLAEWNWVGKGIDVGPAVREGAVATDVRTRVVIGLCFAQRGRMHLKTTKWLSPEGFERASSHLHSPSTM
jgi:hypothetical protein